MGQCEMKPCVNHGSATITKIIFLDVDGVLNSYAERDVQFKCECLFMLKTIVEKSNAVIVLSTSWRLRKDLRRKLREKLALYHLPCPISVTPRIKNGSRVSEILLWLKVNTNVDILKTMDGEEESQSLEDYVYESDELEDWRLTKRLENITHWLVLDDLDFSNMDAEHAYYSLIYQPSKHIIHTNPNEGLTVSDSFRACRLLGLDENVYCSCEQCHINLNNRDFRYDFVYHLLFCSVECVNKYYDLHHINK
jgi:hypothetical protein